MSFTRLVQLRHLDRFTRDRSASVPEDAEPAQSSGGYSVCQVIGSFVQVNSVPSRQMAWSITAILRAVATAAFLKPFRALSRIAQDLRGEKRLTCVINDVAAETSRRRISASPHFEMRPDLSISPD